MQTRIAVLKKDLIDIMLTLDENNNLSTSSAALKTRSENRRKVIKKLQWLTEVSDAELKNLYWKKQYSGM